MASRHFNSKAKMSIFLVWGTDRLLHGMAAIRSRSSCKRDHERFIPIYGGKQNTRTISYLACGEGRLIQYIGIAFPLALTSM